MKKITTVLVLLAITAVSCMSTGRLQVTSAGSIKNGDTIIVGRVVFDPPLTSADQKLLVMYSEEWYKNIGWMITGGGPSDISGLSAEYFYPYSSIFTARVDVSFGETFYSAGPARSFYILGGCFYKEVFQSSCGYNCTSTNYKIVLMPGDYYIDVQPGDKAVYVGTIKYYRDKDFKITRAQVIDEYDREMPAFRRLFGTMKLKKALMYNPEKVSEPKMGSF
jgi:hypothetical protein